MFKNANDIKKAVDEGRTVNWKNEYYVVMKDRFGEYNIVCTQNNNVIGLTWQDGKTLNGELWDFYDEDVEPMGNIPLHEPMEREQMMLDEISFLRRKLQEQAGVEMNKYWNYPRSYIK